MKKTFSLFIAVLILLSGSCFLSVKAEPVVGDDVVAAPMRRPISPKQPMWLIHIDTWNWPDPQKIIDLIPEDIRPFAVMNISLSISHNEETGEMNIAPDGYEIARSWLRTCAENRVWATVQCASGGFSHFSEYDLSVYEEFYRDYPNFIGWNFAEQFWGYDDKFSCSWLERMGLFAQLMKMAHRYGGYLITSWCGAFWGANLNPIAMMKRSPEFAAMCERCPEHFILCEKFTMTSCFHEIESTCLGTWLSGYAGQYGIRFDQCGWHENFGTYPEAAGAIPVLSHMMLTGETVTDGPELIWQQDFREAGTVTTADGYTARRWEFFPQFVNISIDVFRKILDGSVRILDRKEVIDRTKVVILQDVKKNGDREEYMSPAGLFKGLYQMDEDGEWLDNIMWFKKSGRYPAVPTVYRLADSLAQTFDVKIRATNVSKRWPTVADKVKEFNTLFPEEYTGDAYFSRVENAWVGYNPYVKDQAARGTVPFLYNTCEKMEVVFNQYSLMQLRETSDRLDFYLTNYRTDETKLRTDTIRIYGAVAEPTYTFIDRASHQPSRVAATWSNDVFTLVVSHNGPLDLSVQCAGAATGRLTEVTPAVIRRPAIPSVYTGPRQYEAESFDYKNIDRCVTNGFHSNVRGYTGQGYLSFGKKANAAVRDTITVDRGGFYQLRLRYAAPEGAVRTVNIYVNGTRVTTMNLTKSKNGEFWKEFARKIKLKAGRNEIRFSAASAGTYNLYLDNMVIEAVDNARRYDFTGDVASTVATTPVAEMVTLCSGAAGVVKYVDAAGVADNAVAGYESDASAVGAADLDLFPVDATDYSIVWKGYADAPGVAAGVLMRAGGASCVAGMKAGYLFMSRRGEDDRISLSVASADAEAVRSLSGYVSDITAAPGVPVWYRASVSGDRLLFECSADSLVWQGASQTSVTDAGHAVGASQIIWGYEGAAAGWAMDDIALLQSGIGVSRTYLDHFSAYYGRTERESKSFYVSGSGLIEDIQVSVEGDYEISLKADGDYAADLTVPQISGESARKEIFVRLKDGLEMGDYAGTVTIATALVPVRTVSLSGKVVPPTVNLKYDFESDAATTIATTIPAKDITVGKGNSAKAGVVDYTDASGLRGHWLKAYGGGQRNGTGILNLSRFTDLATDYSVTWKQAFASADDSYKVGVLLRGNKAKVGTSSTGYVQGMMQGYVFIVYNNCPAGNSEFRIYSSTASTNLTMLANGIVGGLNPSAGQPVWYRASAQGENSVTLRFEYSTDSVNWKLATVYTDVNGMFKQGSTQVVWGLAAATQGFCLDDIVFDGVTYDESVLSSLGAGILQDGVLVAEEFYTLTGQRVTLGAGERNGFYIVRRTYSDGRVESAKVWLQK